MKSSGKKGLGRGLGALLPSAIQEVRPGESVEKIQIAQIVPNRYQPRQHFDTDKLKELADSIKHFGVLQPVVLRKLEEGYELVSGERRCRASTLAGEKTVPAVVRDYTDKQMSEIALVENLQRDDLNPIEEAVAYKRLSEEFEYTQEQLAERMGKSRPAVANTLRLLQLAPSVQRFLIDRKLTPGQVRPLLAIQDEKAQTAIAIRIADEGLSARSVEELMKKKPLNKVAQPVEREVHEADLEDRISKALGTKAKLKVGKAGKGSIEIEYYSLEDLERLLEIFSGSVDQKVSMGKKFVL